MSAVAQAGHITTPEARAADAVAVVRLDEDARRAAPPARHRLGFALFVVVNAVLFVRPAEIVPALQDLPIYMVAILLCLACSVPAVVQRFNPRILAREPSSLWVIGLLPAVVLSNLSHGNIYDARVGGLAFAQVLVYYLLLVGLVDTPSRFRTFLLTIMVFVVASAILALLQWHDVIDLPVLRAITDQYGDDADGEGSGTILRLVSTGIFHDPNDFALILTTGLLIGLHALIAAPRWRVRLAWLVPTGVLGYAFILTRSRGGMLALLAGVLALTFCRFGRRRTIAVAALIIPMVLIFGGRQADIDLSNTSDTGVGRILLWRDGLELFHQSPLFGIGRDQFAEQNGFVAHNSYVHAFTELGLFGGTTFVGALFVPLLIMWSVRRYGRAQALDPDVRGSAALGLLPCVIAILVAYAVGLNSLSRCYVESTYAIIGIAGAYCGLLARCREVPPPPPGAGTLLKRVLVASFLMLVYLHVMVRLYA
jgi:O-antigen ligase